MMMVHLMIISVHSAMKNLPSPPTTRVDPSRSFSRAQREHWQWSLEIVNENIRFCENNLLWFHLNKVFREVLLLELLDSLPQAARARLLPVVGRRGDDRGGPVVQRHPLFESWKLRLCRDILSLKVGLIHKLIENKAPYDLFPFQQFNFRNQKQMWRQIIFSSTPGFHLCLASWPSLKHLVCLFAILWRLFIIPEHQTVSSLDRWDSTRSQLVQTMKVWHTGINRSQIRGTALDFVI